MAKKISALEKLRQSAVELWDESFFRSEGEPKGIRKFIHFWVLVWRSFVRNRCPVRASALSYTTLLAMIPMLAVAMSVSSMFLKSTGEKQIEDFIQEFVNRVVPQYEVAATNSVAPALTTSDETNSTNNPAVEQSAETNSDSALRSGTNTVTTALKEAVAAVETNHQSETNETAMASSIAGPTNSIAKPPIADKRVIAAQKEAAQYIHGFIQNTYTGTLGATGMFFLFITAIMTLTRIEEAFNDIWGVARGRDWLTRITNYVTTIILGPALLVCALGLASGPHFEKTRDLLAGMPVIELLLSKVLPVVVICISFTLFYKLVPNTKVHFSAALMGGGLAGILWHVYNMLGFLFASRVLNTSKIYGGFALVPLFMGGLYMVWLTVLFGAQVAYAFQNREAYLQEKLVENVNQRGREFVALRLMTCIGQRFERGLPLATVPEMSRELGVPSRLIQQVLHVLLNARLVVEISRGEPAYGPARPLQDITAHHVLMAMRATQGQELVTRDEPVREEVYGEFARIQAAEKEAASKITMLALVNRAQARLELAPPPAEEEIKLTPALAPATSPTVIELERASTPVSIPTPATSETPGPEISSETKPVSKPEKSPEEETKPAESPRRIAEPVSDEERDFPL